MSDRQITRDEYRALILHHPTARCACTHNARDHSFKHIGNLTGVSCDGWHTTPFIGLCHCKELRLTRRVWAAVKKAIAADRVEKALLS